MHKAFSKEIIETMTSQLDRPPVILSLSNPIVKAECTNQEAYDYSGGTALFASGSPYPPILTADAATYETSQCNNFYVFPSIGLGAHFGYVTEISDSMIVKVSQRVAAMVSDEELRSGKLLPEISKIREISVQGAVAFIR